MPLFHSYITSTSRRHFNISIVMVTSLSLHSIHFVILQYWVVDNLTTFFYETFWYCTFDMPKCHKNVLTQNHHRFSFLSINLPWRAMVVCAGMAAWPWVPWGSWCKKVQAEGETIQCPTQSQPLLREEGTQMLAGGIGILSSHVVHLWHERGKVLVMGHVPVLYMVFSFLYCYQSGFLATD